MRYVSDETSNPFGLEPPCSHACEGADGRSAVFAYGDPDADVHVVGDHPGVHGGAATGIPFTDGPATRLLDVLERVGLLTRAGDRPELANCVLSYRYCCCLPAAAEPTPAEYARLERFFDAELRAITADVLVPVGRATTRHVLETYTARSDRLERGMDALHATQLPGRGFLVVPVVDPGRWDEGDAATLVAALEELLASDYEQVADLGRFLPGDDSYLVR